MNLEKNKKTKINKFQLFILVFTILYVLLFGLYYIINGNFEFIWYVIILVFLIIFVSWLHSLYNFSSGVLLGVSIWGLIHMAGGSVRINGTVLYRYIIYPLFSSDVAGTDILRYDQFAHFYCYFFVTLLLYYIMNAYVKKDINRFALSILIIFMAMGIGALNERLEFIPVLILENTGVGDYFNTLWDIIFNTLGSIVAVVYIYFRRK